MAVDAKAVTPAELAAEMVERGVPIDVALDAVGIMLDTSPDAVALVMGWVLRMQGGLGA